MQQPTLNFDGEVPGSYPEEPSSILGAWTIIWDCSEMVITADF